MERLPKDVLWLIMTEYLPINAALICLRTAKMFACRHPLKDCGLLIKIARMKQKQNQYLRQRSVIKCRDSVIPCCQHCALLNPTKRHLVQCKKRHVPEEEPDCVVCGAKYPNWKSSPHWIAQRSLKEQTICPFQSKKCKFYGISYSLFFPETCGFEGCQESVFYHEERECGDRVCGLCDEVIDATQMNDHCNGQCRVLRDYFGYSL